VRRALLLLLALATVAACASSQDPGITPSTSGGSVTTSRSLQPCPAGGPDATTPAAGCIGKDGAVLRP
jgi:hypothetical protein